MRGKEKLESTQREILSLENYHDDLQENEEDISMSDHIPSALCISVTEHSPSSSTIQWNEWRRKWKRHRNKNSLQSRDKFCERRLQWRWSGRWSPHDDEKKSHERHLCLFLPLFHAKAIYSCTFNVYVFSLHSPKCLFLRERERVKIFMQCRFSFFISCIPDESLSPNIFIFFSLLFSLTDHEETRQGEQWQSKREREGLWWCWWFYFNIILILRSFICIWLRCQRETRQRWRRWSRKMTRFPSDGDGGKIYIPFHRPFRLR